MAKSIHRVTTVIRESTMICPGVRQLTLTDPDGWDLPAFTPGAHVDVHLPSGLIRQYSLCNEPKDRSAYLIAVREDLSGRGGSKEVHNLMEGQELHLSLPRNLFELEGEDPAVMVAGGIGITPFMSALPQLSWSKRTFCLHMCAPSPNQTPFFETLAKVPQVKFHHSSVNNRINFTQLLTETPATTPIYCCGPNGMIKELCDLANQSGHTVIVEHFGQNADPSQKAYEIKIASSGQIVPVTSGQTMLDALRQADIEVPASCEGGICLDCKTRYLDGTPEHRDILLPKSERATHLTPCVSGCRGNQITLDL